MSAEWIKTAKVGDKVVCVDDRNFFLSGRHSGLISGEVYEVEALKFEEDAYRPDGVRGPDVTLRLVGVNHPQEDIFPGKIGYSWIRFRLVSKRPTDISIFTDMLKPVSNPIHEEA